jgi:GTPase SAR1 family protein
MGAANVGKSSFINRLLTSDYKKGGAGGADKKKNKKENVPQATVSNLPGTTLNFLKIKMPNGVTMIDTPGMYILYVNLYIYIICTYTYECKSICVSIYTYVNFFEIKMPNGVTMIETPGMHVTIYMYIYIYI